MKDLKVLVKRKLILVILWVYWEIDVFYGKNDGLVIAEIELKDENEDIKIPDWITREISNEDKYLNFNLSINPYMFW